VQAHVDRLEAVVTEAGSPVPGGRRI